jgi:hypothetical protein
MTRASVVNAPAPFDPVHVAELRKLGLRDFLMFRRLRFVPFDGIVHPARRQPTP